MLMVFSFALAGAFFNALAGFLERRSGRYAPQNSIFSPRLSRYLFHNPLWFKGVGLQIAAFVCEAVALKFGQLSFVEPVMALDLLFLLSLIRLVYHVPLGVREWLGATILVIGLAGFLLSAAPTGGTAHAGALTWIIISGVIAVSISTLIIIALHIDNPYRAIALGLGTGLGFALTEAFTKLVANQWQHGILYILSYWALYALAAAGVTSVIFMQHTYSAGPLAVSQPALMTSNIIGSVLIGVSAFGDTLRYAPITVAFELGSGTALLAGFILLSGSETLTNVAALRSRAESR